MSKLSLNEIDELLNDRRLTKSKFLRQVDNIDTEIIGLKIEREKRVEVERSKQQQKRDTEHR